MPPAVSCVGIGDPHHFYVHSVYLINGVMMSVVFLYGWYLSGCTIMGGIAMCCILYKEGLQFLQGFIKKKKTKLKIKQQQQTKAFLKC